MLTGLVSVGVGLLEKEESGSFKMTLENPDNESILNVARNKRNPKILITGTDSGEKFVTIFDIKASF